MVTSNKHLREQIKIKLKNLVPTYCSSASQDITTKIINSEIFIHSQNIACYIPIENEVDTWPIIKSIWERGKNCYLPALSPSAKNHLCFIKFIPNDKLLQSQHFKILEPEIIPEKTIPIEDLDLVITPLVGFTSDNFRLGRGAGSYDRTFAFENRAKSSAKPYLLGVGYKCQHIEFVPSSWDVVMDEIVAA